MGPDFRGLAQLVIHRFNHVRRANDLAQFRRERQKRGEPLPRAAPCRHRRVGGCQRTLQHPEFSGVAATVSHLTEEASTEPRHRPGQRITSGERERFSAVLNRTGKVNDAATSIMVSLPIGYHLAEELGWISSTPVSATRGKIKTKYSPAHKNAL